MKCNNCNIGFVLADYNTKRECPHCGHVHEVIVEEATQPVGNFMSFPSEIIKKVWKFICWPFVTVANWLKSCLPNK